VTVFFALLVCALILWQIRDELRPDEPQQVHWTSPVDDEWIECRCRVAGRRTMCGSRWRLSGSFRRLLVSERASLFEGREFRMRSEVLGSLGGSVSVDGRAADRDVIDLSIESASGPSAAALVSRADALRLAEALTVFARGE
jgi:hypothetical protein